MFKTNIIRDDKLPSGMINLPSGMINLPSGMINFTHQADKFTIRYDGQRTILEDNLDDQSWKITLGSRSCILDVITILDDELQSTLNHPFHS